jgi:hypothetical protein
MLAYDCRAFYPDREVKVCVSKEKQVDGYTYTFGSN